MVLLFLYLFVIELIALRYRITRVYGVHLLVKSVFLYHFILIVFNMDGIGLMWI